MTTLHEFVEDNREKILSKCLSNVRRRSPGRTVDELGAHLRIVLDEISRALQSDRGLPTSVPPPDDSSAAQRHGAQQQQSGYAIEELAYHFGSISDAIGELAGARGLSFEAREYQVLNRCVDAAIAAALEEFAKRAQHASDADEAKRLGFIAHELRNALASTRVSFGILRRGQVAIHSKTGDVLDRGLKRLEGLVNQMLLAVQVHGGVRPQPQRLRVGDLLREVEVTAVAERDIAISIEVEEALEVNADERLIVSALSNLVQNALKFTRPGGHISLRGVRDGDDAVIEVEDECGGLPPGDPNELFRPYVRGDKDRRGVGLGLAITREAIEAHGGHVCVRNLPGKGCVFAVRMPAASIKVRDRSA